MKAKIIINRGLIVLLAFNSCFIHATVFAQDNVLYGERSFEMNVDAVFLDQDGSIYPDYFIPNESLIQSKARLHVWYKEHSSVFLAITKKHNCPVDTADDRSIQQLEDTLLAQTIRKIESLKTASNTLNVLVHGYRKPFFANENDVTSIDAFANLEDKLNSGLGVVHPTLKIYWDASYNCCYSMDGEKNREMFEGFERAYHRADTIGESLKRLLNTVTYAQINFVGHSLAAKVLQSCLYDLKGNGIPCLSQGRVNVCLIAPATTGIESWVNFQRRNYSIQAQDNVRIWLLYNEKDFALKKKDNHFELFGPGAEAYGATTLGCNHKHTLDKFEKYTKEHFVGSTFIFVDGTSLGKIHSQFIYLESPFFEGMIDFLR